MRLEAGGDVGLGQLLAGRGGAAAFEQIAREEAHVGAQGVLPDGLGGLLLRGRDQGRCGRGRRRRRGQEAAQSSIKSPCGKGLGVDVSSAILPRKLERTASMTSAMRDAGPRRSVEPLALDDRPGARGARSRWARSTGRPDEQPVQDRHGGAPSASAARRSAMPSTRRFWRESDAAQAPPWWRDPAFAAPDQPVVGDHLVRGRRRSPPGSGRGSVADGACPPRPSGSGPCAAAAEGAATCWGDAIPPGEVPEGPIGGPWPLGRGTPNGFGVLDPGTVVHEWCLDALPAVRSRGRGTCRSGGEPPERRSSRGGSWRHRQRWSPPSARSSLPPAMRYADYGFRVLREEA